MVKKSVTALFSFGLTFSDMALVFASRLNSIFYPAYNWPIITPRIIALYIAINVGTFFLTWVFIHNAQFLRIKPIFNIRLNSLILATVILHIILLFALPQNARYISGSFLPITLFFYFAGIALTLVSVLAIKVKLNSGLKITLINKFLIIALFVIIILRIDGLSSALTIFSAIGFLVFGLNIKYRLLIAPFIVLIGILLLYFSINAKFTEVPHYFTPSFFIGWTLSRFAIPGELTLHYLNGTHYLKNFLDVFQLSLRTLANRIDFITQSTQSFDALRSIGSANYYTLYGFIGGGASPGYVGSLVLLGPLAVIPFFICLFPISQMFRRIKVTNLFVIPFMLLLTRPLYSNLTELFGVISSLTIFTLIVYIAFVFCRFEGELRDNS